MNCAKPAPLWVLGRQVCVGCALLLATSFSVEAKDEPKSVTVRVDCAAGQSVNEALNTKADMVTIEIAGLCEEAIRITRDDVSLAGAWEGSGLQAPPSAKVLVDLDGARRVRLNGLTLLGGETALAAEAGASFRGDYIQVSGASFSGVAANGGATGDLYDSDIEGGVIGAGPSQGGSLRIFRSVLHGASIFGAAAYLGGSLSLGTGTIVEGSSLHGVVAAHGGHIQVYGAVIQDSAFDGIVVWAGGTADVYNSETIIRGNRNGIVIDGGSVELWDEARIIDSWGMGVMVSMSGSLMVQGGPVIEGNGWGGVSVGGSSSARFAHAIIRDNIGDGIHIADTSVVAFSGGNEIVNNAGHGIFCEPAPAVAQASGDPGTVSGNGAGQISCPGLVAP